MSTPRLLADDPVIRRTIDAIEASHRLLATTRPYPADPRGPALLPTWIAPQSAAKTRPAAPEAG